MLIHAQVPGAIARFLLAFVVFPYTLIRAQAVYSPGPTYSLAIPPASTTSSASQPTNAQSNPQTIYFQLSAPDTYQWLGLGIGSRMAGATIFLVYADGTGNVTLSVRNGGQGHVEPQVQDPESIDVQLLAGSGVVDGVMRANVLCTNCTLLPASSSSSSTSTDWIAAWNIGSALNSQDNSYTINQHNDDSYRQFTFDTSAASIQDNTNPFLTNTNTNSSTNNSPSSAGSSDETDEDSPQITHYQIAHGTLASLAVVLVFPLGAILMRWGVLWWVHAFVQSFGLLFLVIAFGLGVKLADLDDELFKSPAKTHTILGTVVFVFFLLQPAIGLAHHYAYQRQTHKGPSGSIHKWYGRVIMLLGVINGGLGLSLADNTTAGKAIYGVLAGAVGVAYLAFVLWRGRGKRNRNRAHRGLGGVSDPNGGGSGGSGRSGVKIPMNTL